MNECVFGPFSHTRVQWTHPGKCVVKHCTHIGYTIINIKRRSCCCRRCRHRRCLDHIYPSSTRHSVHGFKCRRHFVCFYSFFGCNVPIRTVVALHIHCTHIACVHTLCGNRRAREREIGKEWNSFRSSAESVLFLHRLTLYLVPSYVVDSFSVSQSIYNVIIIYTVFFHRLLRVFFCFWLVVFRVGIFMYPVVWALALAYITFQLHLCTHFSICPYYIFPDWLEFDFECWFWVLLAQFLHYRSSIYIGAVRIREMLNRIRNSLK